MESPDYQAAAHGVRNLAYEEKARELEVLLVPVWIDLYLQMTPARSCIDTLPTDSFNYVYDNASHVPMDQEFDWETDNDDRLVVVHGSSVPVSGKRNDANRRRAPLGQREWGPTAQDFPFDRGHYIAHKMGGYADWGLFPQRRDINLGRSDRGRVFRSMERFCIVHPGTFVFARPIYRDRTAHPHFLEYGLLRPDGSLWIEMFENRYTDKLFREPSEAPAWFLEWAAKERAIVERKATRRQRSKAVREKQADAGGPANG